LGRGVFGKKTNHTQLAPPGETEGFVRKKKYHGPYLKAEGGRILLLGGGWSGGTDRSWGRVYVPASSCVVRRNFRESFIERGK